MARSLLFEHGIRSSVRRHVTIYIHIPRQVLSRDHATFISKPVCTFATDSSTNHAVESGKPTITSRSSSFLSLHQESYVRQIVPSQCLAQPMAMPLAVVRYWGEQAMSIMGQASRCCMVCLMTQSHVSCSLENLHFIMFTLDRTTCVRNRLSTFQVVASWECSSAMMLRCTPASKGSSRSLTSLRISMRAAFAVGLMDSVHFSAISIVAPLRDVVVVWM